MNVPRYLGRVLHVGVFFAATSKDEEGGALTHTAVETIGLLT